ncbi:MAG: DNA-processing protein DprA [Bdellovibrionota bacterium]
MLTLSPHMDHALFLSHLPYWYSHCKALDVIKAFAAAPDRRQVEDLLKSSDRLDREKVQKSLEIAYKETDATISELEGSQITFTSYWSKEYPERLRSIPHPPWGLFSIGTLPKQAATLAVVGTRKPNAYGRELIGRLLPAINVRPLQVVSGLAYGIDALAHFYSCEARLPNFAVLGTGLQHIYPSEHFDLAQRIVDQGGGLISEYPPSTTATPGNFPRRNRIISGLAHAVWIVQGGKRSGSLHTAKHALDQNREIGATPGDIFSELSQASHCLLLAGAQPVVGAMDLDLMLIRSFVATPNLTHRNN